MLVRNTAKPKDKGFKRPEIGALSLEISLQVNQQRTRMNSVLLSEGRQNKRRENKSYK